MNTAVDYMYRDASNYKLRDRRVFPGEITAAERDAIIAHLDGHVSVEEDWYLNGYFIPVQLGWEHLAADGEWNFPGEDDHPWHELTGIEPTGARPTEYETIHEFVTRFCAITKWRDDLPANATPEDAS